MQPRGMNFMAQLPLSEWRDFYVMIGTAAGVIVGAAFIVATLASGLERREVGMRGFITPIVVHLSSVLVGSAILAVPTLTRIGLAALLGAGGLAGLIYSVVVARRIWSLNLDASDRCFYVLLPIVSYGTMAAAAIMAYSENGPALETLAASLVVLLFTGIRNSWDMVSFMITRDRPED